MQHYEFFCIIHIYTLKRLKFKLNHTLSHFWNMYSCVLLFFSYTYMYSNSATLSRLFAITMSSVRRQKLNPSVVCNCGRLISFTFYKITNLRIHQILRVGIIKFRMELLFWNQTIELRIRILLWSQAT